MIVVNEIQIEMTEERREQIIQKWSPIMNAVLSEKSKEFKDFLCFYSHEHAIMEQNNMIDFIKEDVISPEELEYRDEIDPYGEEIWVEKKPKLKNQSYLPTSIYLLSKLNLENKNIFITNSSEFLRDNQVTISVNRDVDVALGIESSVIMYENLAIKEISHIINKNLEIYENFYIESALNDVVIEDPLTLFDPPKIVYKSRYGFS